MMSKLEERWEMDILEKAAYVEGQTLTASSLNRDGDAVELRQRLHGYVAHAAGVIGGLLRLTIDKKRVTLSPGAAVDRLGRLLLIDEQHPGNAYDSELQAKPCYHVWLRYRESIPSLETFQEEMTRVIESPEIILGIALSPNDLLPSTESRGDEVYLGVFETEMPGNASGFNYVRGAYARGRTYVSAVGARIESYSGNARITLGPETARDSRRFAISTRNKTTGAFDDQINWESTGALRLKSRTSLSAINQVMDRTEKPVRTSMTSGPSKLRVGIPNVAVTLDDLMEPQEIVRKFSELKLPGVQEPSSGLTSASQKRAFEYSIVARLNLLIAAIIRDRTEGNLSNQNTECTLLSLIPEQVRKADEVLAAPFETQNEVKHLFARRLVDLFFKPFLRPMGGQRQLGAVFNGTGLTETKIPAGSIALVETEVDKQRVRELRISFLNPGDKGNQPRYRCSLGSAIQCVHGPALSQQTGMPRGILSILANETVEVHEFLNVRRADNQPGLIVQANPPPVPGTEGPVVKVVQEQLQLTAQWSLDKKSVVIAGKVESTKSAVIQSITILVSIIQRNDATVPPQRIRNKTNKTLPREQVGIELAQLFDESPSAPYKPFVVPIPNANLPWRLNVLILGVNDENNIVQFQQDIDNILEPTPNPLPLA